MRSNQVQLSCYSNSGQFEAVWHCLYNVNWNEREKFALEFQIYTVCDWWVREWKKTSVFAAHEGISMGLKWKSKNSLVNLIGNLILFIQKKEEEEKEFRIFERYVHNQLKKKTVDFVYLGVKEELRRSNGICDEFSKRESPKLGMKYWKPCKCKCQTSIRFDRICLFRTIYAETLRIESTTTRYEKIPVRFGWVTDRRNNKGERHLSAFVNTIYSYKYCVISCCDRSSSKVKDKS